MKRLIKQTEIDVPIEIVGGKARGLFKLKSLEKTVFNKIYNVESVKIPSFFIIPSDVNLSKEKKKIIEEAKRLGGESYAIRSSSPLEDNGEHSFDGIFDTKLKVPLEGIIDEVHNVRKSATSEKAISYSNEVGISLVKNMPVIIQNMVVDPNYTGIFFSKFPCAKNIVKMIREDKIKHETYIEAFEKMNAIDGSEYFLSDSPIISPKTFDQFNGVYHFAEAMLQAVNKIGHQTIIEFAYNNKVGRSIEAYLFQARRLTKVDEPDQFKVPQLNDKGLIAQTHVVNSIGDKRGVALVVPRGEKTEMPDHYFTKIEEFDRSHQEGYILVAPFLQFFTNRLDRITPSKKAVVAYTDLGVHHDFEIARKKDILYLGFGDNNAVHFSFEDEISLRENPIKTGEEIRVVSDGLEGFLYNLSRS